MLFKECIEEVIVTKRLNVALSNNYLPSYIRLLTSFNVYYNCVTQRSTYAGNADFKINNKDKGTIVFLLLIIAYTSYISLFSTDVVLHFLLFFFNNACLSN